MDGPDLCHDDQLDFSLIRDWFPAEPYYLRLARRRHIKRSFGSFLVGPKPRVVLERQSQSSRGPPRRVDLHEDLSGQGYALIFCSVNLRQSFSTGYMLVYGTQRVSVPLRLIY